MNIITDLFPSLSWKRWKEVNLNDEARLYWEQLGFCNSSWNWNWVNPLIDPEACAKFIQWVHAKYSIDFSFGWYGEKRDVLWKGTYLDKDENYYHLGLDINVPSGTELMSPIEGKVRVADHDRDHPNAPQHHGWGNRIIIRPRQWAHDIIFAHLSDAIKFKVWATIKKWQPLWTIGTNTQNGGWFEHFHIQAVIRERLCDLLERGNLAKLDGYSGSMDEETRRVYPNPFHVLSL